MKLGVYVYVCVYTLTMARSGKRSQADTRRSSGKLTDMLCCCFLVPRRPRRPTSAHHDPPLTRIVGNDDGEEEEEEEEAALNPYLGPYLVLGHCILTLVPAWSRGLASLPWPLPGPRVAHHYHVCSNIGPRPQDHALSVAIPIAICDQVSTCICYLSTGRLDIQLNIERLDLIFSW